MTVRSAKKLIIYRMGKPEKVSTEQMVELITPEKLHNSVHVFYPHTQPCQPDDKWLTGQN